MEWYIYPFKEDYQKFNSSSGWSVTLVPYKFKTFYAAYQVLSISESNPFTDMHECRLRYRDGSKYYSLQFSYFDYIKYRIFLKCINNEIKFYDKKKQNTEALERSLAFNNILQERLKKEGRRSFKDVAQQKIERKY